MKTAEQIRADLEEMESAHYYSEDFQWLSAVRAYRDELGGEEVALFRRVVLRRLLMDGSMTDILLCSVDDIPGASSVLAAKLDRESMPSQHARALITALQRYRGDDVFRAVARFVDSDQENEALRVLASIDFPRAFSTVVRALQKEHQRDLMLHILHDRSRVVGLETLLDELRAFAVKSSDPDLAEKLCHSLRGKVEPYNPFSEKEVRRLAEGLSG